MKRAKGVTIPIASEYEDCETYEIGSPLCWPNLVRGLAVTGKKSDTTRVPCRLLVGTNKDVVLVSGDPNIAWSERVEFTMSVLKKRDLNYEDVSLGFARYCPGMTDGAIASSLLGMVMGTNPARRKAPAPTSRDLDRDAFLAGMATLMFGVEASRFPSALVTGFLLLDLIIGERTYGRDGIKRFTLANAFHSNRWDNDEWYGGKYPYAVHGTGSGNMVKRNELASGNSALLPNFRELPQRHAVPRREVSLLVHWLEAKLSRAKVAEVTPEVVVNLLIERLSMAFIEHTIPWLPKGKSWQETGTHSLRSGELLELTRSGRVVWHHGGLYYHYDERCKLFPMAHGEEPLFLSEYEVPREWLEAGDAASLHDWQSRKIAAFHSATEKTRKYGERKQGSVEEATRVRKQSCPKCGRQERAVEEERWLAEKKRAKEVAREEREKKAKSDPNEAWKLKLDQLLADFTGTGKKLSRAEMVKYTEGCPTPIFTMYSKRLQKLMGM